MTASPSRLRTLLSLVFFAAAISFSTLQIAPLKPALIAQVYSGPGLTGGTSSIIGVDGGGPREVIISLVKTVLAYMALIATVMILVAGIWLIVGATDDSSKEKAKKIITYTIAGLIIILLAEAIVTLVIGTA